MQVYHLALLCQIVMEVPRERRRVYMGIVDTNTETALLTLPSITQSC